MSLVAYDNSSDEESDYEDNSAPKGVINANTSVPKSHPLSQLGTDTFSSYLSDKDSDILPYVEVKEKDSIINLSKLLPKPKNDSNLNEACENIGKPSFLILPSPRSVGTQVTIEEYDDEFLHKKPNKNIIENSNKHTEFKKIPVKITIPSLKTFKDVEKEMADKTKNKRVIGYSTNSGSSGLLSILPKARSEKSFAKFDNNKDEKKLGLVASCFVPDTVKHRRPATNTEDVDGRKPAKKKLQNENNKISIRSNKQTTFSDESDDENNGPSDFFSFNSDQSLPSVSTAEINTLVAKKAAKINEITTNYLKLNELQKSSDLEGKQLDTPQLESSGKRHQDQQLNSEALHALVGGSIKRKRQQQSDIQVIDINSSQVLPNRDEWMRTALASSTTYQPTGVLVDEEPASGTRRKHQITYLAHKAKANEAELQAMWSANRQNRRATQSKYGF